MKIKPLKDRIFIDRFTEKSTSLIELPDSLKEKADFGKITAAGPESKFKVGDVVFFGKFSGSKLLYEGIEYFWMQNENVIGVVNGKA